MKLHTKGRQRNQKDRLRVIIQSAQLNGGGDVAQFLERQTGTPLTQVRLPGAARDFSPEVNFQCGLSYVCPYTHVRNRMH